MEYLKLGVVPNFIIKKIKKLYRKEKNLFSINLENQPRESDYKSRH